MNAHTPGPWFDTSVVELGFQHDDELAVIHDTQVIAGVWPQGDDEFGKGVQRANARLIAAAPELLDAAKQLVGIHNELANETDKKLITTAFARWSAGIDALEAAIAKAEGGAA